jgi:hypothetical protein
MLTQGSIRPAGVDMRLKKKVAIIGGVLNHGLQDSSGNQAATNLYWSMVVKVVLEC